MFFRQLLQKTADNIGHLFGFPAVRNSCEQEAGFPVYQCHHIKLVKAAVDQISFPVPNLAAPVGFFRPLLYRLVDKMPAFLPFSLPSSAFSPQMLLHGISSMPVLPCPFCLHKPLVQCPVDGGIAHQLLPPLQLDSLCDLLGRPLLLGQQTNDQVFEFSFLQKFFSAAALPAPLIFLLRLRGPVLLARSISFQFPADGRYRASCLSGDFSQTFSGQFIFPYTFSLTYGKMLVVTHGSFPPSGLCRNYHFSRELLLSHSFYFCCCTCIVKRPVEKVGKDTPGTSWFLDLRHKGEDPLGFPRLLP